MADCDKAIAIDQSYTKSYLTKANALLSQNKFEEGLEVLKLGVQVDPDNQSL